MKIANFSWQIESALVAHRDLFFKSGNVFLQNNELVLPPYSTVSFDTYFNSFPASIWSKYTNLSSLFFEFDVDNSVSVDIFGLKKRSEYCFSELITKIQGKNGSILLEGWQQYDLIYVHISSQDKAAVLRSAFFSTNTEVCRPISVSYCICTFNRPVHVKKLCNTLLTAIEKQGLNLSVFIANNGQDIQIPESPHIQVIKNRNLGGAGGFTRAALAAIEFGEASHIVLMDDDIDINVETLFRTQRFLEFIKDEHRDYFITGSMLSSEERWLQYERNTIVDDHGFHHQGHFRDLRCHHEVIESATVSPIKGVGGWWFCIFPRKMMEDFGLPMPLFIRGDDIEFSLRCDRFLLSIPGICVWHEPFVGKYSELMEDYYLPRNMIINALIAHRPLLGLIWTFVGKKFIRNLLTWNYVSLEMNILAVKHVLDGCYRQDPAKLHVHMSDLVKQHKSTIPFIQNIVYRPTTRVQNKLTKLILFLLGLCRLSTKQGMSRYGFGRTIGDFIFKKSVLVVDQNRKGADLVSYQPIRLLKKIISFGKLYVCLKFKQRELREVLLDYREQSTTISAWKAIFDSKG